MHIWRAVRGEGSELGNYSRARVLPPTGERGPSSAYSPDPECSPECSSLCWDRNGLKVRSRGGGGTLEDER